MSKPALNVFEVLDITHEKYYSRVLAWLLDPNGSHRQKDFFLKWFLKTCGISPRTRYERVILEELIGGTAYDPRRRIDIALRCEGYLVYVEVKIDNRSINKLQLSEQYELGRKQAERENRKFIHVFLTPDDTISELVRETETKHVTWGQVRYALRERVCALEGKAKQRNTSVEQAVVLQFLLEFVDRIEKRVMGEFVGLDRHVFKRRAWVFGNYVDELAVRSSLGDFLAVVAKEVKKRLPASLKDTPFVLGTRSSAGCYLYYYFYDYHRLNIQLFFDLVTDSAEVGLWLNSARHRPKLLPELEVQKSILVGVNTKWPKKGAWAAIGPNIWDINNSDKMMDRAVEQLTLYLKVFGPIIKSYVRRNQLGMAGQQRSRQVEPQDVSESVEDVPYPPDENQ